MKQFKSYQPMLAKTGEKTILSNKNYFFEPKLDGTRAILYKDSNKIKFINRRNKNITYKYPEFSKPDFIKRIKLKKCVFDGEIVVYNKKGLPDFNLLQSRDQLTNKMAIELRSEEFPATFVVFDILESNGKNLLNKSLTERKKLLEKSVDDKNSVVIQKIFYTDKGRSLWNRIIKMKLEGVMAKRKSSKYQQNKRTNDWLKIKNIKTMDCIVVGYTSKRRKVSALCLGAYIGKKIKRLTYIGRVGTGFTERFIDELEPQLRKLIQKSASVPNPPQLKETVYWLKPKLIAEVKYLEVTKYKELRAPSFVRLRGDKPMGECILG